MGRAALIFRLACSGMKHIVVHFEMQFVAAGASVYVCISDKVAL